MTCGIYNVEYGSPGNKNAPGRFAGGAQSGLLTVASSRTWRGSKDSAAPVPPERPVRIIEISGDVKKCSNAGSRSFFS